MKEILSPQSIAQEAKTFYKNKEFEEAAKRFKAAAEAYSIINDQINEAEMLNNCSVAYLQSGNAQAALDSVSGTVKVFYDNGDQKRMAIAYANRAAAFEGLGQYENAIEDYQKSSEILKELGEDEKRSQVLHSISALQLKTKDVFQALASMQASVNAIDKPKPKYRLLKQLLKIPFKILNRQG